MAAQNLLNDLLRAPPASPDYVKRVAVAMYVARFGDWVATPTNEQASKIEGEVISKSGAVYTKHAENFLRIMGSDFTLGRPKAIDGVVVTTGLRDKLKQALTPGLVDLLEREHGEAFTNELLGEISTL